VTRGVKVTVVDSGMKRAQALLKQPRKKLMLGVLPAQASQHHSKGVTIGEVAVWMEYGFYARNGEWVEPRSWLFDWLDENINTITRQLATDTLRVLFGKPPESEQFALEKRGGQYRRQVLDRIEFSNDIRENKPSTIRRKGGLDTPLIDTEKFINAILYKVE